MKKAPKLCQDKEACVWTPRCRYVHPENGEVFPASGEKTFRQGVQTQGFVSQDRSQQPPGWSSLPPPALHPAPPPPTVNNSTQGEQERRAKVVKEFLQLIVPNLMCMTDFPNLEKRQNQIN